MDTQEEYSCSCGHLNTKFNEGKTCPKCGTEVAFRGMTIDKNGWIDLSLSKYDENGIVVEEGNGFHVIEYVAYSQLEKVIGRESLRNIIHTKNTITITGELDTTEIDEIRNENEKQKYWFIGLEEFYKKYDEVLNYYYELSGSKNKRLYDFLKSRDEVFTDKIPVISIILRPAMRTADGLKLDPINIMYQNILKNIKVLKDINTIEIIRNATIEIIQAEYFQLSEEIMENVKSKFGIIRNQICGTRVNFSARNIISPAKAGIKIDEMVLPYLTFLELYRFEIINILKTTEGITLKAAEREWYNATLGMDEKVYKIMKKMVKDNEIGVLLNRKRLRPNKVIY